MLELLFEADIGALGWEFMIRGSGVRTCVEATSYAVIS